MPEENETDNYISLQEAIKYCKYSQEYLSLRARQGKLKAVKFGRNWVTKKEWLQGYIAEVEEYNNVLGIKKAEKTKPKEARRIKLAEEKGLPPENLPVGDLDLKKFIRTPFIRVLASRLQFAAALALILLIVGIGIVFNKTHFQNIYHQARPRLAEIASPVNESFKNITEEVSWLVENIYIGQINLKELSRGNVAAFWEYFQWFEQKFAGASNFVKEKLSRGFKAVSRLFQKSEKIALEELAPRPTEEGMVVIPSAEKDEEAIKKIKESFSDEVKIEPEGKTSGIIIPVFREGDGERYLYVLVPIKY